MNTDDASGNFRDSLYILMYSLIGVLALIGNAIIVKAVFTTKTMCTFVHILLANMAISDIICALSFFFGLLLCSEYFINFLGGNGYCIANKTIQLWSFQVSSVTMLVVAVDRWLAVFYPFTNRKKTGRAFKIAIFIWLTALVIIAVTSPSLGYQTYFNTDGTVIKCSLAKAFDIFAVKDNLYYQRVQLIVANLLHFWIPFTVICVAYGSITIKVFRRRLDKDVTKTQIDILMMQRWKTIKMLISAVCVFMLCWIPFFVFHIIEFLCDPSKQRPCNQSVMFLIVTWLAFSSCSWNPVVYWLYNETYRSEIIAIYRRIVCRHVRITWEWPPLNLTSITSTQPIHGSCKCQNFFNCMTANTVHVDS